MPSSVIADFRYEPQHAKLTIVFVSGRVYEYYAVPAEIASAFRQAPSKGVFFNTHIRDRYPFREVTTARA